MYRYVNLGYPIQARNAIVTSMAKGSAGQRSRSGQVLTEYVAVAGLLMLVLVMLLLLLYTFREYGGRILNLLASEYP